MTIVYRDGKKLDDRTAKMFDEAQRLLGMDLRIIQGSYSTSVGASAGTHNGGGALDLSDSGMTANTRDKVVVVLRRVGFAAYWRPDRAGVWDSHFHGIALGCADASPSAKAQMAEYLIGGDGLSGTYPDPHKHLNAPKQTWEQYLVSKRPPFPLPAGHSFGTPKTAAVHDGTEGPVTADNVRKIQRRLSISQTGRFGAYTKARVIAWQTWKRLPVSGRVGATTWKAMGL
jgi:peptidoglycan hydrolase-like protein with peptidoglycan-binding domain